MSQLVIDLSHHNVILESLHQAKQEGVRGVIHKATEGVSFVDQKLHARRSLTRDAGLLWGVYHFIRPKDVKRQVDHFFATAEPEADDETLWALDYEDPAVPIDDVCEFMSLLEETTGHSPVLYSGHVLKEKITEEAAEELKRYRLWLAQYGTVPKLPQGWSSYWLWQYTDKGQVPGIVPPTDMNRFEGSAEELADQWSGRQRRGWWDRIASFWQMLRAA